MKSLVRVEDLRVHFPITRGLFKKQVGAVRAVDGLHFELHKGETLALVGESGCGKTTVGRALMGLLPEARGRVSYAGVSLLTDEGLAPRRSDDEQKARQDMAMIFQDPMTSLNPYLRVSDQMAEVLMLHKGMGKSAAVAEAAKMLDAVRIPDAKARITMFPHEFSGGMRQRIMIAMSLLCQPRLLIADEPTTALDVTVQAQIMQLLGDVREEFGTAVILITHDLGIVAGFCDRTLVMYGGQIMEEGPTTDIFAKPDHPYTSGLLKAVPRLDQEQDELATIAGEPPDMSALPPGCPFSPRCAQRLDNCRDQRPALEVGGDRRRACHLPVQEVA